MNVPVGVLVLNLGGPRTLDDVRPFLSRLFSDREIIKLPGGALGQWLISRMILLARLPSVKANYAGIGGGSPILRYTQLQAQGVATRLSADRNQTVKPYIAFRYTAPFADEALRAMHADGIREVTVVSLYPQYSTATTGSSLRELSRALKRTGLERHFHLRIVQQWFDHDGFLELWTNRVCEGLEKWPAATRASVRLLFSAHSLPMSIVESGDPYEAQIRQTVAGIVARLRVRSVDNPHQISFQSQTGPVRWLEPRTDRVLEELGRDGVNDVLVVPISFVSDHIETLYEIDQLFAGIASRSGITTMRRTESLNSDVRFLEVLTDIADRAIRGAASPLAV